MNALNFAIAQAIASNLTGFKATKPYDHDVFFLTHEETGTKLYLAQNWNAKDKIAISYCAPRVNERWEMSDNFAPMEIYGEDWKRETVQSINVSDSKTPQVIAKDITNRILSESFRLQKLAMDRIKTGREALEKKEGIMAELKEVAGDCFKGGRGSFTLSNNTVDFKVENLSIGKAKTLLEFLKTQIFA